MQLKNAQKELAVNPSMLESEPSILFNLRAWDLSRVCLIITGILLVLHVIARYLLYLMPDRSLAQMLVGRLGLDRDGNIPTLFSALLLFTSGTLLFLIYRIAKVRRDKYANSHWLLLCFLFFFLGVDEATQIHEFSSGIIKAVAPNKPTGVLRHAWVIPYLVLSLGVGLYYLRFALQLPTATRNMIMLAGFVYVGSALGFEMMEGVEETAINGKNLLVRALQTVEEVLEMLAIILFNYALMKYLGTKKIGLQLNS